MNDALLKQLSQNGITDTSDGLLRTFIAGKLYSAACATAEAAITKRKKQLIFLENLQHELALKKEGE